MYNASGLSCGGMTIAGCLRWACDRCERATTRTASMRWTCQRCERTTTRAARTR